MSEDLEDFVPTKGSRVRNVEAVVQAVKYESYKSKRKNQGIDDESEEEKIERPMATLDMKRAKFDVIKFGMSGFDVKKREDANVQLAIKLGAKPPKNKYKNYKELLFEKKKEKKQEERRLKVLGKPVLGKTTLHRKGGKVILNRKQKKDKDPLEKYNGKVKPLKNTRSK